MTPISNQLITARVCACFALALGLVTLAGWATGQPDLVRIRPLWTPMVVNTAIGFVLSGAALGFATGGRKAFRSLAVVLGLLLMLLALEEWVVLAFNLSPALSLPELHRPLQPEYQFPGRMAPNTALAFFLLGAGIAFADRIDLGGRKKTLQDVALVIVLIGVLGVIGYSLRLEFLYGWTGIVRMAVHTGVGVFATGFGLWSLAVHRSGTQHIAEGGEVLAVKRAAAVLLVLTATSAGIGGFAFLQAQVERQVRDGLRVMALDRIALFAQVITDRSARAQVAADDSELPERLRELRDNAVIGASDSRELGRWVHRLSLNGFSWVAVEVDGKLFQLGGAPAPATLTLPLASEGRDASQQLLWSDGYVLRSRIVVRDEFGVAGVLLAEQPMPPLTAVNLQTNRMGATGEMAVCGPSRTAMLCFPLRARPQPHRLARVVDKQPRPMDFALRGLDGVVIGMDYRNRRVLAAYGPIGRTGLGLVVKRELEEIYTPIRRQFQRIVVFLVVLLALGQWVMRRRLRPLLRSLESSRAEARAESARFEAAVDSHLDSFFILEAMRDPAGRITDFRYVHLNEQGTHMLGLPQEQVVGHGMCELFPVLRQNGLLEKFIYVMDTGEPMIEERESVVKGDRWYHMQAVRLGDGIGLTVRDVTDARIDADRIRHQALHDPLTGLANRAGFEAALERAIADAAARGHTAAIALLDLDGFKQVNDTLGHAAGDLLLQEVARRLRDTVRPSDVVARLGGDEFVLILPNLAFPAGVESVARKLIAQIARPVVLDGEVAQVTGSLGITAFPRHGTDATTLLRQADEAMYLAKNAGRNRYVLFDTEAPKP